MADLRTFFMKAAFLLADNSKCVSHRVGAVIVKDDRIISMGYNGTPPGIINCNEKFDPTDFDREEHTAWSLDNEIHGEMNSLMFAAKNDIGVDGCDIYVTISPCNECLKNMVMSGIKNVYFYRLYDRVKMNENLLRKISVHQLCNTELDEFIEKNDLYYDINH